MQAGLVEIKSLHRLVTRSFPRSAIKDCLFEEILTLLSGMQDCCSPFDTCATTSTASARKSAPQIALFVAHTKHNPSLLTRIVQKAHP